MSTFCEDFPSECNNAITDDKEIEIVVDCEADPLGEECDQPDPSSDVESDPEPIDDDENIDLVVDQEDQDESSAMES